MKVGFWSPLPPVRSGVADYASVLLRALRSYGQIEPRAKRADALLYHIGNNRTHQDAYRRALESPGVTVLHDAVLQHFFLGALERDQYVTEFVYNYGGWHRGLAEELWCGRASSGLNHRYFRYPMVKRIAGTSRAVVVHNPAAAEIVRHHAPAAPVIEIPHLFIAPALPSAAEVLRYRASLGISSGDFVFGVLGYLRESKRLMGILRVFERLRAVQSRVHLVVAGDFVSSDLARAAAPWLGRPGIIRLPHLQEREFWLVLSALDACINLRHPTAGETSGIAIRAMGVGKAVLFSDVQENARYPETSCVRIPTGPAEEDSLWRHMILLTSNIEAAREIGRRGAAYIALHHSAEEAARQYWTTLCEYRC